LVRIAHLVLLEYVLDVDRFGLQTALLIVHFVKVFFLFFEFFPNLIVELRDDLKDHIIHVCYWYRVIALLIINFVVCESERH